MNKGQNNLATEKSSYLLQHKDNPVHWWSWGPAALQKAKELGKPIFLSIGYSTCHWCHVMAHESFEDQETADLMNELFINIKVDREELPDVDQFFQLACQVTNGRGGWPLSVFLTDEAKPYYIGTYFPKEPKQNMPSFKQLLRDVWDAYHDDRAKVLENAEKILTAIKSPPQVSNKVEFQGHYPSPAGILNAMKNYQDGEHGGYGTEPKFPHFSFFEWAVEQSLEGMVPQEFSNHILFSLEKMMMGGIYDHARGGIHRYSVDKEWKVPHFEKMLYDQAGLLKLLGKASLLYPSPLFFDGIIQTLDYLQNEMTSEQGHIFSAQDADSEGSEGLYFTFTKDEFIDALIRHDENLTDEMDTLLKWFDISDTGNFTGGLNVISLNAKYKNDYYEPKGWELVRTVRAALKEERKMRIPPHTDNKGVAGWNFMLASALIDLIQYSKIEAIRSMANDLLARIFEPIHTVFIKSVEMPTEKRNVILHTTTREDLVPLFENYVYFAEMQLRFYEITGNELLKANGLQTLDYLFKDFYQEGKFYNRSLKYELTAGHENIHVSIWDQSYRSPLATLIILVRKWATDQNMNEYLKMLTPIIENLTQLSLQNPFGFGETLRALTYPDSAYRKIEVPKTWLTNTEFTRFFANFSVRFALVYHQRDEESWQICTLTECELQGTGLADFTKVFTPEESTQESTEETKS
jgi:uncharacterized protein YyaL (SSP411 family)